MMKRTRDILFITAIIIGGIGLGLVLNHFIPCNDYTTPLFIVLAIHIISVRRKNLRHCLTI